MARFRITHHETRKSIEIVRDVRHQHPEWVHEQMETESEAKLQMVLDQYDIDAYRLNPGPDSSGVEMIDDSMLDEVLETIEQAGPDAVMLVNDCNDGYDVLVWESQEDADSYVGERIAGRWTVPAEVLPEIRATGICEI